MSAWTGVPILKSSSCDKHACDRRAAADDRASADRPLGEALRRQHASAGVDELAVRRHQRDIGVIAQAGGHHLEAARRQQVVVMDVLDVCAGGLPEAGDEIVRLAAAAPVVDVADALKPRVVREPSQDHLGAVRWAVVADHDLEVVVGLIEHAGDGAFEIGRATERHQHADQRPLALAAVWLLELDDEIGLARALAAGQVRIGALPRAAAGRLAQADRGPDTRDLGGVVQPASPRLAKRAVQHCHALLMPVVAVPGPTVRCPRIGRRVLVEDAPEVVGDHARAAPARQHAPHFVQQARAVGQIQPLQHVVDVGARDAVVGERQPKLAGRQRLAAAVDGGEPRPARSVRGDADMNRAAGLPAHRARHRRRYLGTAKSTVSFR